jgi:hypothetical protein
LSHISSPFCSAYFEDGMVSRTVCTGWCPIVILLISASQNRSEPPAPALRDLYKNIHSESPVLPCMEESCYCPCMGIPVNTCFSGAWKGASFAVFTLNNP